MKWSLGGTFAAVALVSLLSATEASASHNADLLVGASRKKLKGDNIYGTSENQTLRIRARRQTKAFVRFEHDLNAASATLDGQGTVRAGWNGRRLAIKVFRLTGGRKNVTAQIRTNRLSLSGFMVGDRVDFLSKIQQKKGPFSNRDVTTNMDWFAVLTADGQSTTDSVRVNDTNRARPR